MVAVVVDVVETWLRSGKFAVLDNIALRPRSGDGVLHLNESEEGLAYHLVDSTNKRWILKKFSSGAERDHAYLQAIPTLIPQQPGFECGFARRILSSSSASRTAFYSSEFVEWLDGAILM